MNPSNSQLKITIAKLIEVAYSQNSGVTTSIMREKGNFTLRVDQNGHAILSGEAGILSFSGDSVLKSIGATIKRLNVDFTKGENNEITYKATFSLAIISLTVVGEFDVEELITSCSGLLCKTARVMKNKHLQYELELQRIMGK